MRDTGTDERAGNQDKRKRWLVWCVVLIICWASCTTQDDPAKKYNYVQQLLLHGEVTRVHQESAANALYYSQRGSMEWAAAFKVLDATALNLIGMNSEALADLNFSLSATLESSPLAVRKHTQEALAYTQLHKFPEADTAIKKAIQDCPRSNAALMGDILKASGLLSAEKGNYASARNLFGQTLALARSNRDRNLEGWALLDLSYVSLLQNRFDEAIDWANSAYQVAIELNDRMMLETAQGNLGWANYEIGDSEGASGLLQQAAINAHDLGAKSYELAWLTTIGYIQLNEGELRKADKYYQQALSLARGIDSKEDIFNAVLLLAFVTVQTGQLDQAKNYSDEAISMARADGNRTDELYALLAQGQVAARTHNVPQAEKTFEEIAAEPKVDLSLRWEAQHEIASLYEEQRRTADADKSYRAALTTFETARDQLQHEDSKLPFLNNSAQLYDDYVRFLLQQKKTDEALRVADFSRAQTLEEGLGLLGAHSSFHPVALNAPQIAGRLHSTILFYWLGAKQSYLWAINERGTNCFTLPAETEINNLVEHYRKALVGPRDPLETGDPSGIQLYDILIAPAQKIISGNSSRNSAPPRVIIVPDGSLNNLNFETLISTQPKPHYWIEDVTLSDASSIRMLSSAQYAQTHGKSAKLLLIGDPVAPNTEYFELPKAAEEMRDIEQHFPPSEEQIFTRAKATPAAYLDSNTAQFSYIHFVAHGTASRLSPLDSAVVLSKSTAEENSFKLYARDIISRPLHADLVTISTCYGAGARAYTGEGLVGLSWAFLRAGAHNVIGALWEVSDSSTPQLMDALYGGLEKGEAPEDALRAAKLSLLHSDGVYRKAFYWAPFQLYAGR